MNQLLTISKQQFLILSGLCTVLFTPHSALAAQVISVGDGDTLRINEGSQKVTVRLACLDAPESSQPGGQSSANRLKQLLPVGTQVSLQRIDTDRYGRTVAIVSKGNLNINLTLVQEGQAVVYRQYLKNCPNGNRFLEVENQARQRKLGFWSLPDAVMPWDWRRGVRATSKSPNQPQSFSQPSRGNLPACTQTDCNCSDFGSQAQARQVLEAFQGDPFGLDGDADGIACESLPKT